MRPFIILPFPVWVNLFKPLPTFREVCYVLSLFNSHQSSIVSVKKTSKNIFRKKTLTSVKTIPVKKPFERKEFIYSFQKDMLRLQNEYKRSLLNKWFRLFRHDYLLHPSQPQRLEHLSSCFSDSDFCRNCLILFEYIFLKGTVEEIESTLPAFLFYIAFNDAKISADVMSLFFQGYADAISFEYEKKHEEISLELKEFNLFLKRLVESESVSFSETELTRLEKIFFPVFSQAFSIAFPSIAVFSREEFNSFLRVLYLPDAAIETSQDDIVFPALPLMKREGAEDVLSDERKEDITHVEREPLSRETTAVSDIVPKTESKTDDEDKETDHVESDLQVLSDDISKIGRRKRMQALRNAQLKASQRKILQRGRRQTQSVRELEEKPREQELDHFIGMGEKPARTFTGENPLFRKPEVKPPVRSVSDVSRLRDRFETSKQKSTTLTSKPRSKSKTASLNSTDRSRPVPTDDSTAEALQTSPSLKLTTPVSITASPEVADVHETPSAISEDPVEEAVKVEDKSADELAVLADEKVTDDLVCVSPSGAEPVVIDVADTSVVVANVETSPVAPEIPTREIEILNAVVVQTTSAHFEGESVTVSAIAANEKVTDDLVCVSPSGAEPAVIATADLLLFDSPPLPLTQTVSELRRMSSVSRLRSARKVNSTEESNTARTLFAEESEHEDKVTSEFPDVPSDDIAAVAEKSTDRSRPVPTDDSTGAAVQTALRAETPEVIVASSPAAPLSDDTGRLQDPVAVNADNTDAAVPSPLVSSLTEETVSFVGAGRDLPASASSVAVPNDCTDVTVQTFPSAESSAAVSGEGEGGSSDDVFVMRGNTAIDLFGARSPELSQSHSVLGLRSRLEELKALKTSISRLTGPIMAFPMPVESSAEADESIRCRSVSAADLFAAYPSSSDSLLESRSRSASTPSRHDSIYARSVLTPSERAERLIAFRDRHGRSDESEKSTEAHDEAPSRSAATPSDRARRLEAVRSRIGKSKASDQTFESLQKTLQSGNIKDIKKALKEAKENGLNLTEDQKEELKEIIAEKINTFQQRDLVGLLNQLTLVGSTVPVAAPAF